MTKEYGSSGWILGQITYTDGLDVTLANESTSGTIPATFTGTLKEAIAAAPGLGSQSELLSGELRLYKRSFTQKGSVVEATFTYGIYSTGGDSDGESSSLFSDAQYELKTNYENVPLLQHADFKNATEAERVLAQAYINGNTDATAVWASKSAYEIATSVPEGEESGWEKTTLGRLVKKFAPNSELVKLAQLGKKTKTGNVFVWVETKTTASPEYSNKLGEKATPRGRNFPPSKNWRLESVYSKQSGTDEFGNKTFNVETTWKADENSSTD